MDIEPALGPSHRPSYSHCRTWSDCRPLVGGGLDEAACMLILTPILPSWVLSGLGLSVPICEQMDMIVMTADPCEINT